MESVAWRARAAAHASPPRRRGARARRRRSAAAARRWSCRPRAGAPVSGSTSDELAGVAAARPRAGRRPRRRARRGAPRARRAPAPTAGDRRPGPPRGSPRRRRRARGRGPAAPRAGDPGPARPRVAAARRGPRPAPTARRSPTRAGRPPRGGSSRGASTPQVSSATRPARRTASRPITTATPSATSDLSRAAVPKRHRGREVEQDPGRERPLGHVLAHVRHAGAGAGGGVEPAHVVAHLVGPHLGELGAPAAARRPGGRPAARPPRGGRARGRAPRPARRASRPGPGARRARRARVTRPPPRGCRARRPPGRRRRRAASTRLEHVVGRDAVAERVVGEHEPVAQHVGGEVGDVLGERVAAAAQQRERLGGLDQADRPARARAVLDQRLELVQPVARRVARGVGERDGVADHVAVDEHALRDRRGSARAASIGSRSRTSGGRADGAADDRRLLPHARVVDEQLEQEAVDLRLGQRIGALGLDRVLRGEHEERRRHAGRSRRRSSPGAPA